MEEVFGCKRKYKCKFYTIKKVSLIEMKVVQSIEYIFVCEAEKAMAANVFKKILVVFLQIR